MQRFQLQLASVLSACALLGLCGCVASERNVARRIDPTCQITQQATALFARDPEFSRMPIVIDGFKGDMRLKGQVETPAQKVRAGRLLWGVREVRSVENDLEVVKKAAK